MLTSASKRYPSFGAVAITSNGEDDEEPQIGDIIDFKPKRIK